MSTSPSKLVHYIALWCLHSGTSLHAKKNIPYWGSGNLPPRISKGLGQGPGRGLHGPTGGRSSPWPHSSPSARPKQQSHEGNNQGGCRQAPPLPWWMHQLSSTYNFPIPIANGAVTHGSEAPSCPPAHYYPAHIVINWDVNVKLEIRPLSLLSLRLLA